jgi:hypothetical protein
LNLDIERRKQARGWRMGATLFAKEPRNQLMLGNVAEVCRRAQGNHCTGTVATTHPPKVRLARCRCRCIAGALLTELADPKHVPLTVDRRIDSVPVFDAGFTGSKGYAARLGSEAEIGWPNRSRQTSEPESSSERSQRHGAAKKLLWC